MSKAKLARKIEEASADLIAQAQAVLETVLNDKGLRRAGLARALGVSEATISKQLDGSNLTLETIARIATAMDDEFRVSSKHFDSMVAAGRALPIYETSTTTTSQSASDSIWRASAASSASVRIIAKVGMHVPPGAGRAVPRHVYWTRHPRGDALPLLSNAAEPVAGIWPEHDVSSGENGGAVIASFVEQVN
jgi:predicted transcriptional regulator